MSVPNTRPGASRITSLIIGVAGGSGSGKTTVVRRNVESVGDDQVTVIDHDRCYMLMTLIRSLTAR